MAESQVPGQTAPPGIAAGDDGWLDQVAVSAAAASGTPVDLLGEYLPMLAEAAIHGRRPEARELDAVRELGQRAATQGVGAGQTVGLYLSAAWRLWRQLPVVVRSSRPEKVRDAAEAVLRVLDDAVGVLVDGHQAERRDMIRHEEALRAGVRRRPAPGGRRRLPDGGAGRAVRHRPRASRTTSRWPCRGTVAAAIDRAATVLERVGRRRFGDRDVLVATKDGRLVVVVPGDVQPRPRRPTASRSDASSGRNSGASGGGEWRVAAGRAFPGAYGVARSYEEACEALTARRSPPAGRRRRRRPGPARLPGGGPRPGGHRRPRPRRPGTAATRCGAAPEVLLTTLREYFNAGEVATEAARGCTSPSERSPTAWRGSPS